MSSRHAERFSRRKHFREVFLRRMWVVCTTAWSAFSFGTDIRDNFFPDWLREAWATRTLLSWLPDWDWHVWLIGILFISLGVLFESTFRQRRRDVEQLQQWSGTGAFYADFFRLAKRGEKLSRICDETETPLPEQEVDMWLKDSEQFLLTQIPQPLNELMVSTFHDEASISKPQGRWGDNPRAKLCIKIDSHRHQLNKIIAYITQMRMLGGGQTGLTGIDSMTQMPPPPET